MLHAHFWREIGKNAKAVRGLVEKIQKNSDKEDVSLVFSMTVRKRRKAGILVFR